MKPLLATLGIGTLAALGAVDFSILNEVPMQRVENIKSERVEVIQIGDVVETTLPWKGETGLKVKYDMGVPTARERIRDKRTKQVITEVVTDGFKVDILLDEKPDTNVFTYQIEGWENYDFFYQPTLTQKEINNGDFRPPEIEGSYAVYHKTLKDNNTSGINYETGKVMHIPRPQVWSLSSSSTKVWADLSYASGTLSVTVPQSFLDTANYPVRVDPTFGYTTIGASSAFTASGQATCYQNTSPAETGDISKITVYLYEGSGSGNANTSIYDDGVDAPDNLLATGAGFSVDTTQQWHDSSITYSFAASTDYYICLMNDSGQTRKYDTGGADEDWDGGNTYPTYPDPFSRSGGGTREVSIYATYTASGGGEPTTSPVTITENVIMSIVKIK